MEFQNLEWSCSSFSNTDQKSSKYTNRFFKKEVSAYFSILKDGIMYFFRSTVENKRNEISIIVCLLLFCMVLTAPAIYYFVIIQFNAYLFIILVIGYIICATFYFMETATSVTFSSTISHLTTHPDSIIDIWTVPRFESRQTETCLLPSYDNVICQQNYVSETYTAPPSYYEATLNSIRK